MRLRAIVRSVSGRTAHLHALPGSGGIEITKVNDPQAVEIVERDGAVYLLRLDEREQCITDTWHKTFEEAKAQASFEFGIEEGDWQDIEALH